MEDTLRKHITLPKSAYAFLEDYQRRQGLPNFSATIEAAVNSLKKESIVAGYKQFATDYAASKKMQKEAKDWLEQPMEEK